VLDLNVTYHDAPDYTFTTLSFSVDVFKEWRELMVRFSFRVDSSDQSLPLL
jgi:hypothetical protein